MQIILLSHKILYQADTKNHLIRFIVVATGAVSTVAGIAGIAGLSDGPGMSAKIFEPRGVALDATGTIAVVVSDSIEQDTRLASPQ